MGRQRNIHSEEHLKRLRKSHAERRKPVGFYKKGGKTRPITKPKGKKTRVVKKAVKPKVKENEWIDMWVKGSQTLEVLEGSPERHHDPFFDPNFSEPYYYVGWMDPSKEFHELEAFDDYDDAMDYAEEWIRARQPNPPIQVQRPSKPYDARWRHWITGLITKAGEDPNLVDIHIHSDGVDIIPKWAPGSVFDRENMKRYEGTMALIKAPWNDAGAKWELRDLIPLWVNPQDGVWETDTGAAPKGAKAFYVTKEELHRHTQRNSNDKYEDALRG